MRPSARRNRIDTPALVIAGIAIVIVLVIVLREFGGVRRK
jgi:hypothetical protein